MISIIVAMDQHRGIGKDGALPWRLPEDLQFFKTTTWGKKIVMGRKTFESLPKMLPERQHFVISHQKELPAVENIHDFPAFLAAAKESEEEYFIIGGRQIYEQALPFADKLYITQIGQVFEADTFFPGFDATKLDKTEIQPLKADQKTGIPYRINLYTIKPEAGK